MRPFWTALTLLIPLPGLLSAQHWEVGGSAGYGLYRQVPVSSTSASGTAGFDSGFAFGAVLGNQINRWVGGEARYTYRSNALQVKSGGAKATSGAEAHAFHYDVLVHATHMESPVRPFVAAGAGMKLHRGTGPEPTFQPLSSLVILTRSTEAQPLLSIGGGLKIPISSRALLRLDFRDYATPIPTDLLATRPTVKLSGWMHDFVFLLGISSVF